MLNLDGILVLLPLLVSLVAIYAFFSIAIDVRSIRRELERRAAERNAHVP
jgi:hypothetical protein